MFEDILKVAGKLKSVDGGYELGSLCYLLNSENEDNVYKVSLGTGTINLVTFFVDARHEQDAVDRVVDFCEDNELKGLYTEYEELEEEARNDEVEDVDQYIEDCGLIAAGNSSLYIDLQDVELMNSK